jgi:hypothetical protein
MLIKSTSEPHLRVLTPNHEELETSVEGPVFTEAMSSMPRLAPYRDRAVDVEALVNGCVLAGMMCVICLLFAAFLEPWIVA